MALPAAVKQALALADLPEDQEMRARAEMFMMRSGYTIGDLANKIGYSKVSLGLFLSGRYNQNCQREGNTRMMRARMMEYLDSAEFPEENMQRGTIYRTATYERIRNAFYRALNSRAGNHGLAYCVDGAPGTQKSFIAETLVRELAEVEAGKNGNARRAYYIYCGEHNSPQELLKKLAIEMGIPARGYIEQLIKKIQFELARRRAILLFDEAQHLPQATVERIRELLDRPPYIGILFLGSHDVQNTFANLKMEQWRRRVVEFIVLPGLSEAEAEQIIASELGPAPRKQIEGLIADCIVPDSRRPVSPADATRVYPYERKHQGRTYEAYLSAGALFAAIQQIKLAKEEAAQ